MLKLFRKNKIANGSWYRNPTFYSTAVIAALTACMAFLPQISHANDVLDGLLGAGNSIAVSIVNVVVGFLAQLLLAVTALILFISGTLLHWIIDLSVIHMKDFIENEGITITWKVFRDFANMFFIFILLYISINTILGNSGGDLRKMLARIVIVALLLNFSFFFTRLAVDASNILTVGFYNQIAQTKCGSVFGVGDDTTSLAGTMSNAFMCKLGLTTLYKNSIISSIDPGSSTDGDWKSTLKIIILGIFGSVFGIIAAFVFLAAALLFVSRLVIIIFLFILSPLAFMSMALPNDKWSGEWFKKLIDNCTFAPVFMALMWAILQIITRIPGASGGSTLAQAILGIDGKPAPDASSVFGTFVIIIGLMIGSMVVAQKTGAYGAGRAMKIFKGGLAATGGWLGQNTIGRGALAIDKSLEKRGFDGRTSRFFRDFTTGAVANSKFGGSISRKDDKKRVEELNKDIKDKADQRRHQADLERNRQTIEENQAILDNPRLSAKHTAAQAAKDTATGEIEKILSRMSNKELEIVGFDKLLKMVDHLSPEQFAHISDKSDKFGDQQKSQFKEARFKKFNEDLRTSLEVDSAGNPTARAVAASDSVKEKMKTLDPKEFELMDANTRAHPTFLSHLKTAQMETLMKSSKLTGSEKTKLKNDRMKPLINDLVNGRAGNVAAFTKALNTIKKMNPKDVASLDDWDKVVGFPILQDPQIIAQLGPGQLAELHGKPDHIRKAIGKTIADPIAGIGPSHPAYKYVTTGIGSTFFDFT